MKMRHSRPILGIVVSLVCALPSFAQSPILTADYKSTAPIVDGVINAAEYGAGTFVSFAGDANPGRFAIGSNKTSATTSDLSFTMYTSHSTDTLFVGFDVSDQFLDDRFGAVYQNDCVELFVDADHVANDFVPNRGIFNFSREGFQLLTDVRGVSANLLGGAYAYDGSWGSAVRRTGTGYTMEFAVPFVLMDKVDGAGYAPVTSGDHVNFNVAIDDNDRYSSNQDAQGGLYILDPDKYQVFGIGEDGWPVDLYLAPQVAAVPEPGILAFGVMSGVSVLSLIARKRRKE